MQYMNNALQRLYKTKLTLLAVVMTVAGAALLVLDQWALTVPTWHWLMAFPVTEIGSAVFTTGLIVVAFEYLDKEDAEVRAMQRLKHALHEEALGRPESSGQWPH